MAALLATGVAATAIMEPITAIDFHQVTPIAILANLIVIPAAGLITMIGTLSVAVSLASAPLAALLNTRTGSWRACSFSSSDFSPQTGRIAQRARPARAFLADTLLPRRAVAGQRVPARPDPGPDLALEHRARKSDAIDHLASPAILRRQPARRPRPRANERSRQQRRGAIVRDFSRGIFVVPLLRTVRRWKKRCRKWPAGRPGKRVVAKGREFSTRAGCSR